MLHPAAGADIHAIRVRKIDELAQWLLRQQTEAAGRELQAINVRAHGFENIGKVAWAHDAVLWPADFGDGFGARFGWDAVVADEAVAIVRIAE